MVVNGKNNKTMKSVYVKTNWIDNKTPVNASNLNKIEGALHYLYTNALGYSDIEEGKGISVEITKDKSVKISTSNEIPTSMSIKGIEYIFEQPECECGCKEPKKGVLYFVLNKETKKLVSIVLNGVVLFEVKD